MTRKGLLKRADDAFGDFVKARDGYRCVTCGAHGDVTLDCSHVIRKARGHFLRWQPDNAYCQCRRCHMEHHNVSELRLLRYVEGVLGRDGLDRLRGNEGTVTQYKDYQLQELVRFFRQKAAEDGNAAERHLCARNQSLLCGAKKG